MHIFEQEKLDGLSDKMNASASISYACVAAPYIMADEHKPITIKTMASYDDEDLYYVQSILVTSSWNKNDDIFDKIEVWKAKNTPEHKPTNLEHNEDVIIGHIISNWPITDEGILISDDTLSQDLPNKYHILTGSVIYRGFSIPELRARSEKLISEIQAGTKYVSMECFFKGFDYGVLNNITNDYKILARNEETAYLTKYLKAYGGLGAHQDYKIGRVLRNITFTGKGFVDRPANIDSIIFTKNIFSEIDQNNNIDNTEEKNPEIVQLGVSISQSHINSETIIMSSDKTQEETLNVDTAAASVEPIVLASTELAMVEVMELKLAKDKLEADLSDLAQTKDTEINSLKEAIAQTAEENIRMKAELDTAIDAIAAYKAKEVDMMKKEKKMKRKASLIEQGVDSETAASVVDKFESMEDEAFDAMTSLFAGKLPPWLEKIKKDDTKEDTKKNKKKASEEIVDLSVLDTVEITEEVNLGIGGEIESEVDSTMAALVDFVRSKIGKKVK